MPASDPDSLLITRADLTGGPCQDILVRKGRIVRIGEGLRADVPRLDAAGCAVLPGLHDRHLHIMATAAQMGSLDLSGARSTDEAARLVHHAGAALPPQGWLRATGWDATACGGLGLELLDRILPEHPVRIQDSTGALWQLNSCALARLGAFDLPTGFERSPSGTLTGRVWREDGWMARHLPSGPPDLSLPGRALARFGVTSLIDTSASQTDSGAAVLAGARRSGCLPQNLALMSAGSLSPSADSAFRIGPVKILIDERNLPDLATFTAWIAAAREQGRAVAVHCVTDAELALTLAAFLSASSRPGDRIEHGSVIPESAIATIRALGLTVVTQPGLIYTRGDRYMSRTETGQHGDLYRCASLLHAGIRVHGSSDAPYGPLDPWLGMRAARDRLTGSGRELGAQERVAGETALRLWLGPALQPGADADFIVMDRPLAEVTQSLCAPAVMSTFIGGKCVYGTPALAHAV